MTTTTSTLEILVKLRDEATAGMRRLGVNMDDAVKGSKAFAVGLLGATAAIGGLSAMGVKTAADLQTAEIGLKTLLGSSEAAAKTIERLKLEAARTPFELVGLTRATQLLSSVTKDGDKAIDILLDVGEGLAAMGKGQAELDRIIVNLQQIAATGRATMLDIRQFAFAGIPIFEMLQQQTGLVGEELSNFISEGGVTFELLTQMFDKANDAGGRFFGAFSNQMGSFNQSLSNLKDSFNIFLSQLVTETGLFDAVTRAIQAATKFLDDHRESIIKSIDWLKSHKEVLIIVAGAILGALVPAIYAAVTAFAALAISLAPFIIGGAIVGGIVAGVLWIARHWDLIRDKTVAVWGAIRDFLRETWDSIRAVFQDSIDWIMGKLQPFFNAVERVKNVGSSIGGTVSGAFSSLKGAIGLAHGGIVTRPTLAVVGEGSEPEAVVPLSRLGALGAGAGVTVNISGDFFTTREVALEWAREIAMEIKRNIKV